MKKLLLVLSMLTLCYQTALAEENNANQINLVEDNRAVISLQKQPVTDKTAQKQDVKRNWFCIVIQINGKIQDTNNSYK